MLKNILYKIIHLAGSLFGFGGRSPSTLPQPAVCESNYVEFTDHSGTRSINSLKRKRAKRFKSLMSHGCYKEALRYAR